MVKNTNSDGKTQLRFNDLSTNLSILKITILENLHIFCKFCEEIYLLNNTDTDNILKK
jgi:hypothetical protein